MSSEPFHTNDCVIRVPSGFRDRSAHVLEWDTQDGERIALVVQRDAIAEDVSLAAFVARETGGYRAQFAGYRCDRDDEEEQGAIRLRHLAFRWKEEDRVLYQHQVFVMVRPRVFIFTGSALAQHRDEVDSLVEDVAGDLQLRQV